MQIRPPEEGRWEGQTRHAGASPGSSQASPQQPAMDAAAAAAPKRPNILFIMADDHAAKAISAVSTVTDVFM